MDTLFYYTGLLTIILLGISSTIIIYRLIMGWILTKILATYDAHSIFYITAREFYKAKKRKRDKETDWSTPAIVGKRKLTIAHNKGCTCDSCEQLSPAIIGKVEHGPIGEQKTYGCKNELINELSSTGLLSQEQADNFVKHCIDGTSERPIDYKFLDPQVQKAWAEYKMRNHFNPNNPDGIEAILYKFLEGRKKLEAS